MKTLKRLILVVVVLFIAIQFIRPPRNIEGQSSGDDISAVISIPDSVQSLLKNACYDCHSNTTSHPWYFYVQPAGWFLSKHIKDGKEELNFSEFGTYIQRRQLNKLEEIAGVINDDVMPLKSYRIMHRDARLDEAEKALITGWAKRSAGAIGTE